MTQNNIRNFCIIAHVDHGKSTLADRFLELTKTVETRKMHEQYLDTMDLERERGITIKLQPVRMQWKEYVYNLIDTPGHVDFSYEVSRSLAAVEGAILLVDATQGIQAQTMAVLHQAQEQKLDIIPVINKIDLPAARTEEVIKEIQSLLGISEEDILAVSAKTGEGVEKVLDRIAQKIKPPQGNPDIVRALIFDSIYDAYRGVIAFVRIVDGAISKNDRIKFVANQTIDQALDLGTFTPKFNPKPTLATGEIGYIVTGLKKIEECQVGDTITISSSAASVAVTPLPGYQQVKPMVFASVYPADGNINKLREALGKLKLNDASLSYESENSRAFGFGFRCGFLGLLHLEIIKERLEREYGVDLIITTPQVNYKEKFEGLKPVYEEPWVNLDIITPAQYIGPVMELANSIRAIYISTIYVSDRVLIKYEAPLALVIVNFYDQLKSASAGYASLNYEFIGYRSGDLVKMDILISGDVVDVLSQIVHRNELMHQAHKIVKKLKELIPKQMFQVTIQAAVGGKILAREDISAQKKDVAGYLYGGDISRKKKLWAKQARGKKKMKKLGRVDIPTDVFIKLLKY